MIPMSWLERYWDWLEFRGEKRNWRGHRFFIKKWGPFLEDLLPYQKAMFLEMRKTNRYCDALEFMTWLFCAFCVGYLAYAFGFRVL